MKLSKVKVRDKVLKLAVADTKESRYKGLSGTKRLGKHKGMLFIFPDKTKITMVMRDMNYDLDFILLDNNWEVIQLGSLDKDDEFGIESVSKVQMIIEVNKGIIDEFNIELGLTLVPEESLKTQLKGVQKFKTGGKFEVVGDKVFQVKEDDVKLDPSKMQILNTEGEVVANISGGARIFSRGDTKTLMSLAKAGDKEGLATAMIAIIERQDSQKQEYVKN